MGSRRYSVWLGGMVQVQCRWRLRFFPASCTAAAAGGREAILGGGRVRFRTPGGRAGLVEEDAPDDPGPDICSRFWNISRGLALILYQRIALGIGLQADRDAQRFDAGQVIDPQLGDRTEQNLAVDLALDAPPELLGAQCLRRLPQAQALAFPEACQLGQAGSLQVGQDFRLELFPGQAGSQFACQIGIMQAGEDLADFTMGLGIEQLAAALCHAASGIAAWPAHPASGVRSKAVSRSDAIWPSDPAGAGGGPRAPAAAGFRFAGQLPPRFQRLQVGQVQSKRFPDAELDRGGQPGDGPVTQAGFDLGGQFGGQATRIVLPAAPTRLHPAARGCAPGRRAPRGSWSACAFPPRCCPPGHPGRCPGLHAAHRSAARDRLAGSGRSGPAPRCRKCS